MINFVEVRTLFKHISSYMLVVVVLVATLQLSVTKMTCLMTGKIIYSVEDIDDCKPVKKGCNVDDVCCDFHKITLDHSIQTFTSIEDFSFLNIDLAVFDIPQIVTEVVIEEASLYFFHDLPPPLSGISLLKTIQVYRL